MKAIRVHGYGGPEVMVLEDVPDPKPGPGQVVVRLKAAGINPVDTYIRSGLFAAQLSLPYTPGSDAAGVVELVGEGVSRFRPGDRVYTAGTVSGAYAELALCEERRVFPMPDRITFQQGAAVGVPYGVAFRALFYCAHSGPGESVLVHGATGGVGIAAVQLARSRGMTVIGTGGTPEGRDLAKKQGAHHVLDHTEEGYMEQVKALTSGRGVDVIIEMLANVNLGRDLKALAFGGCVVVIGSRGAVQIDPRDTMSKDAAIMGLSLFNATPEELRKIHAGLFAGLENGTLNPVIGREMPLADAPEAHRVIMEGHALGKIILLP
ncbi:MAG: NADPH:quinone reductase [Nitrospirota bacterium]